MTPFVDLILIGRGTDDGRLLNHIVHEVRACPSLPGPSCCGLRPGSVDLRQRG